MTLTVLYFASLRERTGTPRETVDVDPASDLGSLWERLVALHPALGEVVPRPMVACDRVYSTWDRCLEGVSEVALLPPVSGG